MTDYILEEAHKLRRQGNMNVLLLSRFHNFPKYSFDMRTKSLPLSRISAWHAPFETVGTHVANKAGNQNSFPNTEQSL